MADLREVGGGDFTRRLLKRVCLVWDLKRHGLSSGMHGDVYCSLQTGKICLGDVHRAF